MEKAVVIILGNINAKFINNLFYTTIDDIEPDATVINSENLYADFRTITEENHMDTFEFEDIQPEYDIEDIRIIDNTISNAIQDGQSDLVIKTIENSHLWEKSDKWLLKKLTKIKDLAEKAEAGKGTLTFRHIDEVKYVSEITKDLVVIDSTVYYLKPVGSDDSDLFPEK